MTKFSEIHRKIFRPTVINIVIIHAGRDTYPMESLKQFKIHSSKKFEMKLGFIQRFLNS
jgi:hypothetical protein